jgi:aminobenzoyl-glutamate utilization protein B
MTEGSRTFDHTLQTVEQWFGDNDELGPLLSDRIFDLAEPGLCEFQSAELLWSELQRAGFSVETSAAGLPTSWIARAGHGRPVIGLMCENDATPGDSQRPVPYPAPISPTASGFVDLHNGIGAASVSAALAVQAAMTRHELAGTIVVYGTAAEKLCIGKPFLARYGYFDDLDAVIAWHPRPYTTVEWDAGPGCYQIESFDFTGLSAYAARPWDGVSALDGVSLMNVAVQFLREHIPPRFQASINEFVTRGGMHPTAIPASAQVWYVSRANSIEGIDYLSDLLGRAADSACLALGTTVRRRPITSTRPWVPNHSLARLAYRNLERVGAPDVPADMNGFAQQVLANLNREPLVQPFDRKVTAPETGITREFGGGADDVTEFCWHAPTARIYVAYGLAAFGQPNWAQAAFARTAAAHATIRVAARAMAGSVAELLATPGELRAAREEYDRRMAVVGPLPPRLPEGSVPPVELGDAPPFVLDYLLRAPTRDVKPAS